MRYSIEPRDRIYVNGYGFLLFAKNLVTHATTKVAKNLSNKYTQNLFDSAKKSTSDVTKTPSKRAIQKTPETTGDLIGNKIADKIASVLKKSAKYLQSNETEVDVERPAPKKRYTSPEERQKIIDELRLVPKNDF